VHDAAYQYVARQVERFGPFGRVVEIGSRNINGSVRPLFGDAEYVGVDRMEGPGVDVVADITQWFGRGRYDCVVCAGVLEHVDNPDALVGAAGRLVAKRGCFILTCAGPGWAPHSQVDGGQVQPWEHYENIDPGDMARWMRHARFHDIAVDVVGNDLFAVGRR
jgi:SAM-dependent methyltransferase